jgi:predicted oxidoreductase
VTPRSELGYGCGSLLARRTTTQSLRLLGAAYESGVRHFDVARSYGHGEAEAVLGRFQSSVAGAVSIYTKVGLGDAGRRRATALALRRGGQLRARVLPAVSGATRAPGARSTSVARFDPGFLRQSVHSSLKSLRTEQLAGLLLHEARGEQITDDVVEQLDALRSSGLVAALGLATHPDDIAQIAERYPGVFAIAQCAGGPFAPPPKSVLPVTVVHSILGPSGSWWRAFRSWCEADATRESVWNSLGADDIAIVFALTRTRSPAACTLITSTDPHRIASNARAWARSADLEIDTAAAENLLAVFARDQKVP